jgi:FMN phosphatase YigB (HAD superfamily)
MSLTLLLDLDDTLLNNDMDVFLSGYLNALSRHLVRLVPPARMVKQLLSSTRKMIANDQPLQTLEESFDADFYPALGTTKQAMRDKLMDFYTNVFPTLKGLTSPRSEAVHLVEYAIHKGWQVVIATNPLFPEAAILHRLSWANLPATQYPFSLVTSYEHFHFAKPDPAFYAEILARMGWPNQPAVMVGNSLSDDLAPAAMLGMPGFWLSESAEPLPSDLPSLSRKGRLEEVIPWLDEVAAANTPLEFSSLDGLLAVLKSTPAVLDTLGRELPADRWGLSPKPNEWCFTEIICHLRDSDLEINLPRISKIRSEVNAFIPAINADEWSTVRSYCSEDGAEALNGFNLARLELIHILQSLSAEDWNRLARHAIFGPSTLRELISFAATHDRTHVQQALQTLNNV